MSESLLLHPLSFVEQGEDVVVGRIDIGSYAVLPADGAELLRRLSDGLDLDQAASWYSTTYGEPVDMDEFVAALTDLGFVSDGAPVVEAAPPKLQWLGRALFSRVAFSVYAIVFTSWVVAVTTHADLRPHAHQVFFSNSLLLVQATLFLSQIPLLFLHESFHLLAGQRLGLHSRLDVSNRYGYVVFETQSNGLLSVPRRKRYLPFMAGILLDMIMVSLFTLMAETTRHADGSLSLIGLAGLAISFSVVLRIAWQFQLYLQTDLYYVFSTLLNCHDLHLASKSLTMNRLRRLVGRTDKLVDEDQWTERDRKVGSWYGLLLGFGLVAAVALSLYGSVPIAISYIQTTYHHLTSGRMDAAFWDAVLSVSINSVEIVAVFFLSRRKRRRDAHRVPRLLVAESVV